MFDISPFHDHHFTYLTFLIYNSSSLKKNLISIIMNMYLLRTPYMTYIRIRCMYFPGPFHLKDSNQWKRSLLFFYCRNLNFRKDIILHYIISIIICSVSLVNVKYEEKMKRGKDELFTVNYIFTMCTCSSQVRRCAFFRCTIIF